MTEVEAIEALTGAVNGVGYVILIGFAAIVCAVAVTGRKK